MANDDGGWGLTDHRRFAQRVMPPGELQDGYLEYLDGLALKAPDTPATGGACAPREPAAVEASGGWTAQRYVLAAIGSVVFAFGTWAITSLL